MDQVSVALDVDGVLFDTHNAVARRSDRLDKEDCPPEDWQFESEEQQDHFLHVAANLWHNHREMIPPMVDDIGGLTQRLSEEYNVDIVTHRTGTDDQILAHLDEYDVEFRNFYSTSGPKSQVANHGVHIDDSPNVITDVTLAGRHALLVDAKYNASYSCNELCMRVSDLSEAVDAMVGL